MSIFSLLLLLSLLLMPLFSSANNNSIITLRLTRASTKPWENLKYLEKSQHHHLKHEPNVQLYPRGIGEYTISLGFGTPPQALGFIMDTGSGFSWSPCTQNYTCLGCGSADIPTFIPKLSSSYKQLTCASSQCKWLSPYADCTNNNNQLCAYKYQHGLGKTVGLLAFETLTLIPELSVHKHFAAGCSNASASVQEGGIMGFGRGPLSLPSQMGLKSFSYCMVSHDFDNNATATSDLILTTARSGDQGGGKNVQYTPFTKNPNVSNRDYLLQYYYVGLRSISVGLVNVKVPDEHVVPDAKGYGGTVMDSGTTVTVMENPMFDLVFNQLQRQVGKKYKRDTRVEKENGLGLCYKVGVRNKNEPIDLPQLNFHFVGGARMFLPLPNYFSYVDKQRSAICMTIINGGDRGNVGMPRPSIILGNYLQQDYYMEYDLEFNRLGIRQQECKSGSG